MDKFNENMTVEEMVNYIRKTPKQYAMELPEKLEKWMRYKRTMDAFVEMGKQPLTFVDPCPTEEEKLRLEIATKILVRHAPAATINPESLADYCVEAADELLKRLKR